MGDSNTGGGGSVHWSVSVKDPGLQITKQIRAQNQKGGNGKNIPYTAVQGVGKYIAKGKDTRGRIGENFTITIKLPKSKAKLDEVKKSVRFEEGQDGKIVRFELPIAGDPSQIHIHWPDKVSNK